MFVPEWCKVFPSVELRTRVKSSEKKESSKPSARFTWRNKARISGIEESYTHSTLTMLQAAMTDPLRKVGGYVFGSWSVALVLNGEACGCKSLQDPKASRVSL